MPRRRRVSKRRRERSLSEILDEVLPPNPLVRRGPDEVDEQLITNDVDFGGGEAVAGEHRSPSPRSGHGPSAAHDDEPET